jgi:hypothetical protein
MCQLMKTRPISSFRSGLVACLLGVLMMSMPVHGTTITMTDWTEPQGLKELVGPSYTAGWLDIDMDGEDEPFWLSNASLWYLNHDVDGNVVLELATVEGLTEDAFFQSGQVQPVLARGDFNRDGLDELWVFAKSARIYRVEAPGVLHEVDSNIPFLPTGAQTLDAAVGDLNGDGWPDVVLARGRFSNEHFYQMGAPDIVLMNRGGHFERMLLEPSKVKQSSGVSMADIDGDGKVDVIESITPSRVSGLSRILLNRTEAGAETPVFEVSPVTFDRGSFGMGVAIQDVDQDGTLDFFHASTGQDFLVMGQPDGTLVDKTWALKINHEWGGQGGPRFQWAPTIIDMNADGRLDLFERHGHRPELAFAVFGFLPKAQKHLIYAQLEDGTFERSEVPYDPDPLYNGKDGAMGDFDGDGLPDLAMGGLYIEGSGASQGLPIFWHNETPKPADTRTLAVKLFPSVSSDPPTGAWVEGMCGDQTQVRHLYTGGHMGAVASEDLYFAWQGCQSDINVTVHWPSGARSVHGVSGDATALVAEEPVWFTHYWTEDAGWQLTLNPQNTAASEACYRSDNEAVWMCCDEDEAPCVVDIVSVDGASGRVRLGEATVELALQPLLGWLTLRTTPALPAPGEDFLVEIFHGGMPVSFDPDAIWLRVGDSKVAMDVDLERRVSSVSVSGKKAGQEVHLTLFTGPTPIGAWHVPNGIAIDERWSDYTLYPNENAFADGPWRILITPKPHNPYTDIVKLSSVNVRDGQGNAVPALVTWSEGRRIRLDVNWSDMEEGMVLGIYEDDTLRLGPLPTYGLPSDAAILPRLASARGFFSRITPIEAGDFTRFFMTLLDAEGYPMPPAPALLEVEVEGMVVEEDWSVPLGFASGWDLAMAFRTLPGPGPASLRVKVKGGGELGTWHLERRSSRVVNLSTESTTSSLSHSTLPAGVGALATLEVRPRDGFGELIGMDVAVTLEGSPELKVGPCQINESGIFVSTIEPGYYGGQFSISVYIDGQLFVTHPLEVVGPEPSAHGRAIVTWPDVSDPGTSEDTSGSEGPEPEAPSGCTASSHPVPVWVMSLLGLFMLGRWRRWTSGRPTTWW